jgi:hypothetical protein
LAGSGKKGEMKELTENLDEWDGWSSSMERAVADHDVNALTGCFHQGTRCFDRLKATIDSANKESIAPYLERIRTTVDRWQGLTRIITPWMDEIQAEIEEIRERRRSGRKLAGAYGRPNNSGKFLNMNAT